jgi:DNA-binding winged helix-turn-helix (wHTH) protein
MAAVFANKSFTINDWRVDPELNRLSRADEVVKIDPQNMKVLELLASRAGEVISQSEIEQAAWAGVFVTPNSVYQSIAQLRRALGDDKTNPKYIETIARKGYRCVASVADLQCDREELRRSEFAEPKQTMLPARLEPAHKALLLLVALGVGSAAGWYLAAGRQQLSTESASFLPLGMSQVSSVLSRVEIEMNFGDAAVTGRRPEQALRHYETALREAREGLSSPTLVADILTKTARVQHGLDANATALQLSEQALELLLGSAPSLHPKFIDAYSIHGETLAALTRYREAEKSLEKAMALAQQLYGRTHARTLNVRGALTLVHMGEGRWTEAEQITRELLEDYHDAWGSDEEETIAYFRTSLAWSLYFQGRYAEANLEAYKSVSILEKIGPPFDPHLAAANQVLADTLVKLGSYGEGQAAARKCMNILTKTDAQPWRIARAASTLGEALLHLGMYSEAEERLTYAATLLDRTGSDLERRAVKENERRMALLAAKKMNL